MSRAPLGFWDFEAIFYGTNRFALAELFIWFCVYEVFCSLLLLLLLLLQCQKGVVACDLMGKFFLARLRELIRKKIV
jgi:hypothetical protein